MIHYEKTVREGVCRPGARARMQVEAIAVALRDGGGGGWESFAEVRVWARRRGLHLSSF
jgi:hypothetical protein